MLFSVVGSCTRHGGGLFACLKDVLDRKPTHPAERFEELLPDTWLEAHPNTRRKVAS